MPVVLKQVYRHRTRSILTILGVSCAMFLFCALQAMQRGVARATEISARDTTLVVYREDRYCPMASNLPEHYGARIEKVRGVKRVLPMRIVPTNCRTSLDVVTFRGVPAEKFAAVEAMKFALVSGDLNTWQRRTDGALVSHDLASRRRLKAGDRFDAAGVTVFVAGVFKSDLPQDQNVAYVHLPFLQQNAGSRKLGVVTQFNVTAEDPNQLESIASQIDKLFQSDQEPTATYPEKAFVARAASNAIAIIGFTRWLGLGCLAAVIALVGNAIVLSVQDRIREHAILQTLGFNGGLIARLIITESLVLGMLGGLVGIVGAWLANYFGRFSLSSEGVNISMQTEPDVLLSGLLISMTLGVVAGLIPAWQASQREIATCFRAV